MLQKRGILRFIHAHCVILPLKPRPHIRTAPENIKTQAEHIVKIHQTVFPAYRNISIINFRKGLDSVFRLFRRKHPVFDPPDFLLNFFKLIVVRIFSCHSPHRIAQDTIFKSRPFSRQKNRKRAAVSLCILPQDRVAKAMNRRKVYRRQIGKEYRKTTLHICGCLPTECQR